MTHQSFYWASLLLALSCTANGDKDTAPQRGGGGASTEGVLGVVRPEPRSGGALSEEPEATGGATFGSRPTDPVDGSHSSVLDCDEIAPPEGGLLTWLHAGDLTLLESELVTTWPSRSKSGNFSSGEASFSRGGENQSAIVRFDGAGQRLHSSIPIVGLDDVTFALVSRTTEYKLAGNDWCQSFEMAISENGCSGTFTTPLMWDEAGDWGFTFLGPVRKQVSFRFGVGAKTYSNLDDPAIQALGFDPNVAWRRGEDIGDALTSTVMQKDGGKMRLYVDAALVLEQDVPGGAGALKNMKDAVWLGGGRGDWHWAGDIAELLVYGRKLSTNETVQLNTYLMCEHPELQMP